MARVDITPYLKGINNMLDLTSVLSSGEKAVYNLRQLYMGYGYSQYKMSKFEEYDLYVRNKDYLVSDSVITFNDTDGKLLALKPDVTLSIIKNGKDEPSGLQKVCYGENVYRPSEGTRAFKEIMQVGLECQGDIDDYVILEVLTLALKSLEKISDDYALDISHLQIVSCVLDDANLSSDGKKQILTAFGQKNLKEVLDVCMNNGVSEGQTNLLKELLTTYGSIDKVMPKLEKLKLTGLAKEAFDKLKLILNQLSKTSDTTKINVDFSVVNNMNYYNGIVFKGFVSGLANGILSGGQYDTLMQKMGKKSGAIGFAVYLDQLEKLSKDTNCYDVDVVVLYDQNSSLQSVSDMVEKIKDSGESVLAIKVLPQRLKYKRLIKV